MDVMVCRRFTWAFRAPAADRAEDANKVFVQREMDDRQLCRHSISLRCETTRIFPFTLPDTSWPYSKPGGNHDLGGNKFNIVIGTRTCTPPPN